ncbi:hypothetical protein [Mycobacterium sp. TY815]|uniref:hypothetical protein n=1 Tax=unclassified Mycobacterium TaxID=2642494 RepID=UPI002740E413|nr:hypothetical protein [Mycobacterium sp. TY815]MDP7706923.1 hypothetical protein [Mycobacterium sp. TY815]
MTLPTAADLDDVEREHIRRIADLRTNLLAHVANSIGITQHALSSLRRLRDNDVYDTEFIDGRDGDDIGAFLNDSIRYLRAAYAVVHAVIDKEVP